MIMGNVRTNTKYNNLLLVTFRVQSFLSVLPSELLDWLLCVCGDICVHV